MASGPEAKSWPNDEGLTELVRRIQIGDQTAIQTFHSMFSPGIEFLLRRKLARLAVAGEAARVLQAAVQEIETASTAKSVNVCHLVTQTIDRLCPPAKRNEESCAADAAQESLAHSILAKRTNLEQDILRRYYVLGESADEIGAHLLVSSQTIAQTIAGARAYFRRKTQLGESA